MKKIEIEFGGQKYWYDPELFLMEQEFRILQERPLIPEFMWEVFSLHDAALEGIRAQLKKIRDESKDKIRNNESNNGTIPRED